MIGFRTPMILGMLGVACVASVAAQQAPAYSAQPEPVLIESTNPYFMYFVAGSDTLGTPVNAVSLERWTWTPDAPGLHVVIELESLLPDRSAKQDTFQLHTDGRVIAINGGAPGLHTRVDLLPRLPREPLVVGTRWGDTLESRTRGPAGEHLYTVVRDYRAERTLDTLGAAVIEIVADGEVRYRDGWWTDDTKKAHTWIDVRGPVHEVIGFDAEAGRLLYRRWQMDLRGQGGFPLASGQEARIPAGLRSASTQRIVGADRAAAVRADPRAAFSGP